MVAILILIIVIMLRIVNPLFLRLWKSQTGWLQTRQQFQGMRDSGPLDNSLRN